MIWRNIKYIYTSYPVASSATRDVSNQISRPSLGNRTPILTCTRIHAVIHCITTYRWERERRGERKERGKRGRERERSKYNLHTNYSDNYSMLFLLCCVDTMATTVDRTLTLYTLTNSSFVVRFLRFLSSSWFLSLFLSYVVCWKPLIDLLSKNRHQINIKYMHVNFYICTKIHIKQRRMTCLRLSPFDVSLLYSLPYVVTFSKHTMYKIYVHICTKITHEHSTNTKTQKGQIINTKVAKLETNRASNDTLRNILIIVNLRSLRNILIRRLFSRWSAQTVCTE